MVPEADLDMSNYDFARAMIDRINKRWSIRIDVHLFNESLTEHERRHRAIAAIFETTMEEWDRHRHDMGLEPDGTDHQAMLDALRAKPIPDEPNIAVSQANFKILRECRGEEVARQVRRLAYRLEQISHTQSKSPAELATQFVFGELVAVGVPMGVAVVKFMLEKKIFAEAVKLAITKVGPSVVVLSVVNVLVGILMFFAKDTEKRVLGLVFNNTDSHLVVHNWQKGTEGGNQQTSGLYMEHGAVKVFPTDNSTGDLSSPLIQVRARQTLTEDNGDDAVVYAGIFMCEKIFGFRGAEGLFSFIGLPNSKVANLMFAVPYAKDNGTGFSMTNRPPTDKPATFRKMYEARKVDFEDKEDYHRTARMNSARGGVASLIATISKA